MMRKIFILMILILFSSSLIYGANCYSSAIVESNASMKIVSSENALIGIPSSLDLNKTINIKNNMSEKIWIKVVGGGITSSKITAAADNGIPIEPGEEITTAINLNNLKASKVTFHAEWNGGSAEITRSINKQ